MPSITKKSKVAMADKVIGRAGSLDPEQVKAEARAFADRVLKRAMKGDAYPSDVWVNAYIRKWRSLSGLHSRSVPGPKPVWLPATSLDAARHARRRSA